LKTVLQQRKQVAGQVEEILDAHPLARVLTSMPGIRVRTTARILLETGEASNFASSAHLRRHRPVTRSSGTSIRGEHPARTGNRKLKRAFFLAALADPVSRVYPLPPPQASSRPSCGLTTT
jgi:transposase